MSSKQVIRPYPQTGIRAVFMRGGSSKALMLHEADIPPAGRERDRLLCALMGSPDPYERQLNGMGGGISSLSKVCIIAPSNRPDADIDFTFAQVAVDAEVVDYRGNCGNMSSAVGPFVVDEGLVACPEEELAEVRIYNTKSVLAVILLSRAILAF